MRTNAGSVAKCRDLREIFDFAVNRASLNAGFVCAAANERMVAAAQINNLDLFGGANVTVLTWKSSIKLAVYGFPSVPVSNHSNIR